MTLDIADVVEVVLRDVIDPKDKVLLKGEGRRHFRQPHFVVVLVPFHLFHDEIGERVEEDFLFVFVNGVQRELLPRERVDVEDASVALLEPVGDFDFGARRGETLPIEEVAHLLERRKPEVGDPSVHFTDKDGKETETVDEGTNELHLFGVEDLVGVEVQVSEGSIDCLVELVAGVVVDGRVEGFVLILRFCPFCDSFNSSTSFFF